MDNALKKLQNKKKDQQFWSIFQDFLGQNVLLRALIWKIWNIFGVPII